MMGDNIVDVSSMSEPDLRSEVERLRRELDQVTHESAQSAEFGLVLLEEKQSLQDRVRELESAYDATKHDLELTKEALGKLQTTQQLSTRTGIENEESLLWESVAREQSLTSQISELSSELKNVKQEEGRLRLEKEQQEKESEGLQLEKEMTDRERRDIKKELRELKQREAALLSDLDQLEEENINLQKLVSSLRQSQVEFESDKHELRRLSEEVDILKEQVEELSCLKRISEKQLEEALDALQAEREAKHALKKELDSRLSSSTVLSNLGSIAYGLRGADVENTEHDKLREMEDDVLSAEDHADDEENGGGPASDLFSEIHLNQLRLLEEQLSKAEVEKAMVRSSLKDVEDSYEKTRKENQATQSRIEQTMIRLEALRLVLSSDDKPSTSELLKELEGIDSLLKRPSHEGEGGSEAQQEDPMAVMRHEAADLKAKVMQMESSRSVTVDDLSVLCELIRHYHQALSQLQTDLSSCSCETAKLYHHVCTVSGQTPSRIMLDHVKQTDGSLGSEKGPSSILESIRGKLATPSLPLPSDDVDLSAVRKQVETLSDQVTHLRGAVETALGTHVAGEQDLSLTGDDTSQLQEEVVKLRALLGSKREQIATLRTVLKANKQTAEVALASLKAKYDKEKCAVSETMIKLRNELRLLKEDAATFSSLRAMFGARCEEYVSIIDETQQKLKNAEEEKRTLNSLLRMAIQQKLVLSQRLEEIDVQRGGMGGGVGVDARGGGGRKTSRNPRGGGGIRPNSGRVGVFWAYAEHYFEERKKKKEQIVQYSETADKYVLTKESGTFPPTIAVSRSIPSVTEAFPKATRLVLYQYRTCPFCCKVRALLDYFGIGYDVVEVNPVTRSTIRWSQWKKVPQLLISLDGQENPEVYQQLNESSMIISILYSYMFQPRPITELAAAYPYISSMKDGKKVTDVGNKYSVMYEGNTARSEEEITDEQKWREWADQTLVHLLSPNVYRTPSEALQAFRWFSDTGHWEETFSHWERLFVIYVGATAMFFIGKRLKKRHRLSDDVRFSLYRECDVFAREVARRKQPFLGGERPNLADLSIYGVLSSIEGCDAFQDLLANSKIGPWYKRTQDVVKHREGRNLFKHPPLVYH
ncbi:unnamed protein product [Cyprideis torosa]|uniref:Glutaredoxin domain-containing protein n=1 Tax=Cyprideis torosa TaxID=163714 RepID=A0A7R8WF89_9CRUS|nr:unnamed protein product [Cyprideis torosa]CAG0893809.1 unnamed protein product [Cyprideis torosa]